MFRFLLRSHALVACAIALIVTGCKADESAQRARTETPDKNSAPAEAEQESSEGAPSPADIVDLPDKPQKMASSDFWDHWGDGKAELAGYTGEVMRYGEPREARVVLIYVTEPHDRRTWIKDDSVEEPHQVNVLKLNHTVKFQTGIYPYSVMTSVFSPVDDWGRPRFQPAKITLTSQEWCGHVFHGIWAGKDAFLNTIHSYFASEGDERQKVQTPEGTLYEDALLIQLRELDGEFNGGEDWSGQLVPSMWQGRKQHSELKPVEATIERKDAELDGQKVTRFVLTYGDRTVTYDIDAEYPRHLLRWKSNDGNHLRLEKVDRLPYWRLNTPGDEKHRKKLGVPEKGF